MRCLCFWHSVELEILLRHFKMAEDLKGKQGVQASVSGISQPIGGMRSG